VQVLIFDLTGVKLAGPAVADALLSTARALRMIGTRVIINGIGAELAAALVDADVEFGQLTISTTLDHGVALASRS
jgi:anti-anti-sigma regulatory factor